MTRITDSIDAINAFTEDYFRMALPNVTFIDIVEIFIIAFFFYEILYWVRNTRAWTLLKGIGVIIAFFVVAAFFQMNTILWLGGKLVNAALIALIVVFQPEMRSALERLGSRRLFHSLLPFSLGKDIRNKFSDRTLNDLVKASYEMGAVKTGALIVIEDEIGLNEYERTGIEIDALLTRQLLINIFEKNTPLHDGAVIVRGDRVTYATCYLPLSDNATLSKDLGTRHRAALGISEVSDALTIIVSEETGHVSVTRRGKLTRNVSAEELTDLLREIQAPKPIEDDEEETGKEAATEKTEGGDKNVA